jgi:hypothetical protein
MNTAREFESRPRHHNGSSQITQVAEAAKKLQKTRFGSLRPDTGHSRLVCSTYVLQVGRCLMTRSCAKPY